MCHTDTCFKQFFNAGQATTHVLRVLATKAIQVRHSDRTHLSLLDGLDSLLGNVRLGRIQRTNMARCHPILITAFNNTTSNVHDFKIIQLDGCPRNTQICMYVQINIQFHGEI